MKTKRFASSIVPLAVIAVCVAWTVPTQADVEKGTGEFGLDLGYTELDSDFGKSGPRVAARLGYYFTDVIGLELMASYAGSSESGVTRDLTAAYANVVVNVPKKSNLIPYFLVGIGGASMDTDVIDDSGVSAQAAAGVRFFGHKGKFGFRIEAGGQWVDTFNTSTTHWSLSGGLTWTVGGPHPHDSTSGRSNWGN